MSRSFNTLKTSDVTTTPIKLKYTATYDSSSLSSYDIIVKTGTNNPMSISGSDSSDTLTYRSIKHLYYSKYLSGSFPVSASSAINWEQSTAASGTIDADLRYFPTQQNSKVSVISIPRLLYGEKISRGSFTIAPTATSDYYIVDDGNGNLVDIGSAELYSTPGYFTPPGNLITSYVAGPEKKTHVGNIFYAQGIAVITNADYLNIVKPTVTTLKIFDTVGSTVYGLTVNGESRQIPPQTTAILYTEPYDTVLYFTPTSQQVVTYNATTQIITSTNTTTLVDQLRVGPGRYAWQLTPATVPLGSSIIITIS